MNRSRRSPLAVLIAEDHPSTRLGIRQILLEEFPGAIVGEAADAATTLQLVEARAWNLLVLDISLPDRHGLDVLHDVKQVIPGLPVLIYSAHPEDQFGEFAAKAGAAGYVTKERAPEELCVAVREILSGGTYWRTADDRLAATAGGGGLSAREFQVLRLTVSGESGKAIANQLGLSQKTVSTYRSRALKKLGLASTADLVRYALRRDLF
jgi:two-component system, NarL family, invasion response regulator UvrY